jgi:hypothetical protein
MATYRKTAKGLAEIATRANKLPPRLRTALILVDGRRTDSELGSILPQEADETLRWLSDSGFIEIDHNAANTSQWQASVPASVPATVPGSASAPELRTTAREAPPASRKPIAQIQREAVRELTELVGPMAEAISLKIEKSRSREELGPLLEIAFQVLSNTRGTTIAQRFRARHIEGL